MTEAVTQQGTIDLDTVQRHRMTEQLLFTFYILNKPGKQDQKERDTVYKKINREWRAQEIDVCLRQSS